MDVAFGPYMCPSCRLPLAPLRGRAADWFCPSCRTAVVLVNERECCYLESGGVMTVSWCPIDRLRCDGEAPAIDNQHR